MAERNTVRHAADPKKDVAKNNSKPHEENQKDIFSAVIVGIYTLVIFVVIMLSLLAVWPRNTSELALNATTVTRTVTFPLGLSGAKGVEIGPEPTHRVSDFVFKHRS